MNQFEVTQNTDFNLSVVLEDSDGNRVDLSTAQRIFGCFDKEGDKVNPVIVSSDQDEQHLLTFSQVPDAGSFALRFPFSTGNQDTVLIQASDTATEIQTAINNLAGFSAVAVSGSYGAGFTIDYTGADGSKDQPTPSVITNTLTASGAAVSGTVTVQREGFEDSIEDTNLPCGHFKFLVRKKHSKLFEAGKCKDVEVRWIDSSGLEKAKVFKGVMDVERSKCPA